jgi:hypothetical protein
MGSVEHHQAEDIIHFYIQHLPYQTDREQRLREEIPKHISYGTIVAIYRGHELLAVTRFNISSDGEEAHVLETVVKPQENGLKLLRALTAIGWQKFPTLKQIMFEREMKYTRPARIHKMKNIFKKGTTHG